MKFFLITLLSFSFLTQLAHAKPRARDLGIPLDGTPGPLNAITDVQGVEVGHAQVLLGKGVQGEMNTARTGVTIVFPKGKSTVEGVPGAWSTLNGNGEMTGAHWLEESGLLQGPITITNTQAIGVVRDALMEWSIKSFPIPDDALLPIIAETDDSWLNDIYGFHIKKQTVFEAIANARSGPVEEGNVGGGTGNVSFLLKAGIGTSSRKLSNGYTVGVLAQCNYGKRHDLKILGVPVGKEILSELKPIEYPHPKSDGSIVVVIATDAPLLPHQLKRLAKRSELGMALVGGLGRNTSGDFFVAFSTQSPQVDSKGIELWKGLPLQNLDLFFEAVVQATEEAVLNSLVAAETMSGVNGTTFFALPHDRLKEILRRYNQLRP